MRCRLQTAATSKDSYEGDNQMSFTQVTVIGTGCMGVSVALGLKALDDNTQLILHAPDATAEEYAHAKGLFDAIVRRPAKACREADLIIVAEPLNRTESALEVIAPHLKPGCFVTDTAQLKAPVLRWAQEHLPDEVHFLGGHPIPNPKAVGLTQPSSILAADPALLSGALYCFTAPAVTSQLAVSTFSQMANELEAETFFVSATEHDGLSAAVKDLPQLLALALVRGTMKSPAWRDIKKFASYHFAAGIEAASSSDPEEDSFSLLENRENMVIRINAVLRELIALRDTLSTGDEQDIACALVEAGELRRARLSGMNMGLWDEEKYPKMEHVPKAGQHLLGRIFFGEGLMRRLDANPDHRRER